MANALRGEVRLWTPPDSSSGGGGGVIASIDYLRWNGSPNMLRWPITIATGGELLICQAHWQPDDGSQQSSFWTDGAGYPLFDFQPFWDGVLGTRIFSQQLLTYDVDPIVPFPAGPEVMHFDPGGGLSEFEGWILHVRPDALTEIQGYDIWEVTRPYGMFDEIVAAGHKWSVSVAGTSGGSEPVWAGGFGGTIGDGSITWADSGTWP